MKLTSAQVLEYIASARSKQKDVGYYNKEIIKKKQRNNKETTVREISSSSGLASLNAPSSQEVKEEIEVTPLEREGQEREALPQVEPLVIQAPTSSAPPPLITSQHIKRAIIQFYHNQGSKKLQERKLKIRLNCVFDQKEENIEFIAALTQDLGNFKKYHPEESREFIQNAVSLLRKDVKQQFNTKAYMGKFHLNNGWQKDQSQVNQIEPWTYGVLWYNNELRKYQCCVRIYDWEEIFTLDDVTLTDKQIKANVKSQILWYNPLHLNLKRPMTWAQKRGLSK